MLEYISAWLINNKDWISPVSDIAVFVSAVFVGIQSKLFFDDYKKRNRKEEFENSFRLTNYYIKHILPKFQVIQIVFSSISLDKLIGKKLKKASLKEFDKEEKNELFEEVRHEQIKKLINNAELSTLLSALGPYLYKNPCEQINHYEQFIKSSNDECEAKEKYRKILLAIFWNIIVDVQNDLEYFSMYFNSHLAESDVIYDSLHQTFTDYVKLLYPFIAEHNSRALHSRKFFSNTKRLYIDWTSKDSTVNAATTTAINNIVNKASKNKKI